MPQIHFNGKIYNTPDDMPPNEKQAYEQMLSIFVDKNGNGIPDFLEGDIVKNISNVYTTASFIDFNGNTYNNFHELPSDVQAKVSTAFNQMASMGIVPQETAEEHNRRHHIHNEPYLESKPFVSREYNPIIQEDKSGNILWLIVGIAIFIACLGIAGAVVFLFLQ